jgi:hypothetical protein
MINVITAFAVLRVKALRPALGLDAGPVESPCLHFGDVGCEPPQRDLMPVMPSPAPRIELRLRGDGFMDKAMSINPRLL